jgi:hypothetical protein
MAINPTSIASQSIKENTNSVIELRYTRPSTTDVFNPPEVPGKLIGYFNGATGFVELFVVNKSGTKLLPV